MWNRTGPEIRLLFFSTKDKYYTVDTSIRQVNFPGHEFLGIKPRFKRRKKNLSSCVYGLQLKRFVREFHVAGRAAAARKCIKKCAARAELLFC